MPKDSIHARTIRPLPMLRVFLVAATLLASMTGSAFALTVGTVYTLVPSGGTPVDWNTPTNWLPVGVPGSASGDTAELAFPGSSVYLTTPLANPLAGMNVLVNCPTCRVDVRTGGDLKVSGTGGDIHGILQLSGGTLTIDNSTVNVGGTLSWDSGIIIGGTTPGTVRISTGGTASIAGSGGTRLSNATFDNQASTIYAPTGGAALTIDDGATFQNNFSGTFDAQNDAAMLSNNASVPKFINFGQVQKSGGSGASAYTVRFDNKGTISVATGVLALANGGQHTGIFTPSPGAVMEFSGGSHTLSSTAAGFTGGGYSKLSSGSLDVQSSVSAPNFRQTGGTLQATATFGINNTYEWLAGTINGSGTLSINSGAAMTIDGSDPSSGFTFLNGSVTVSIPSGAGATYAGTSSNYLTMDGTSKFAIDQGGTFSITTDAVILNGPGGSPEFLVYGTLQKSGGSGLSYIGVPVNATDPPVFFRTNGVMPAPGSSSLKALSGTLSLAGGGSADGTVIIAAGATLAFSGADFTFASSTAFSSAGTLMVDGYGTVTANIDINTQNYTQISGTFTGPHALNVAGTLTWTSGTMSDGAGVTNSNGNAVLDAAFAPPELRKTRVGSRNLRTRGNFSSGPALLNARPFNANGPSVLPNPFVAVELQNGAVFTNNALFDIQNDGSIGCSCTNSPSFLNNSTGTVKKSGGTGISTMGAPFTSYGAVTVDSGTLSFNNAPLFNGDVTANLGGTLSIDASATFSGSSHSGGAGTFVFNNGTSGLAGVWIVSGVTKLGNVSATVGFSAAGITNTLTFDNGTLGGTLSVTNGGVWSGGTLSNATLNIGAGATLTIDNVNDYTTMEAATLKNDGTIVYDLEDDAVTLALGYGSTLDNNGTFDIKCNCDIDDVGTPVVVARTKARPATSAHALRTTPNGGPPPSPSTILNSGIFQKSGGSGISEIFHELDNDGTVKVLTGTLEFDQLFKQTAGSTELAGGAFIFDQPMQLQGGSLTGAGSVTGDVGNTGGSVAPGTSSTAGLLALTGNYTQGSGASLNVKLGGTAAGTQYDVFQVSGPATLDGTLNVSLFNSFVPNAGDTFSPLTYGSHSGAFATQNMPALPGGRTINSSYGLTSFDLAVVGPAGTDLAVTLMESPNPVNNGDTMSYTVTVTNNGPTAATGVNLNVQWGTAQFLSQNSGPVVCMQTGGPTMPISNCSIGNLAANGTATFTFDLKAVSAGTSTATASVSGNESDPASGNNSATTNTAVYPAADLAVLSVTDAPDPVSSGSNITYTINLKNFGPDSVGATVALFLGNATFVSGTGSGWSCSSTTCTLPSFPSGTMSTITVVAQAGSGTASLSATIGSSPNFDPNTSNNFGVEGTTINPVCASAVTNPSPANNSTSVSTSGMLSWTPDPNATSYKVYLGPDVDGGCMTLYGTTSSNFLPYSGLDPSTVYQWRIESIAMSCPAASTSCFTFTTASNCPTQAPQLISPLSGSAASPVTFTWTEVDDAVDYRVMAGVNGAMPTPIGSSDGATTLTAPVGAGVVTWYVQALFENCPATMSELAIFNSCVTPSAPVPFLFGETATGTPYDLSWSVVPGTAKYEVQESTSPSFAGVATLNANGTSATFQHTVQQTTPFYYRVRAISTCAEVGPYSPVVRIVIDPTNPATDLVVPVGTVNKVFKQVFVPGYPPNGISFSAHMDKPWLTVLPTAGILPPEGLIFTVTVNPGELPNGTQTATLILNLNVSGAGKTAVDATTPPPATNTPVSISLVTPVSPTPKGTSADSALIIPSAGHLSGSNSQWQSDIRLANVSNSAQKYMLSFTPSGVDGTVEGKQTVITAASGETVALDDIIKRWYGLGTLNDGANGILEIRQVGVGKGVAANDVSIPVTTVASSRTYNVTPTGTLGQFIPAIQLSQFIAKSAPGSAAQLLSLQQVAQSSAYRTNFGLVEGSGQPASVLVSIFNASGTKLKDVSFDLKAGEHRQMDSFLATNGISSLADGRIQVQVLSTTGKVTAYASVVDNHTNDPLLVNGTKVGATQASRFTIPGVADLNTGLASWRSDLRLFNPSQVQVPATLTFYPAEHPELSKSAPLMLNAGEVRSLDNVLQSLFSTTNAGGSVQVTTASPAPLVVTARTYNQTAEGTFGQFIPAVTASDAVGSTDRALNILQVEASDRFRTNLGLAEVTGKPATVEVSVVVPDSKVTPKILFNLAANEFRQLPVLSSLGLTNTYNARLVVKVTNGEGRVTAYGSVIDMQTQDPTYVPAQ
jgi:hypothetical protein